MATVQVVLFGSPQFTHKGRKLQIERRKSIALLAYLLLSGGPHSRDSLATMLWPENDQSGARANLRRELSRLRQEVGESVLLVDHDQVMINPDADLRVDVLEFQERVKQLQVHGHSLSRENAPPLCAACQQALREAVDLYKGPFMAGFSLPDSMGFDEWQFFQAESLQQSLSIALQHLIFWHSERKEYGRSVEYTRRWLALDNLHEAAHRQLILLYAISGQRSAALRQYQECARLLKQEIGVEPEPETQELYEAIRTRKLDKIGPDIHDNIIVEQPALPVPSLDTPSKQTIGYCISPDGVRIAYATVGEGPVLVKAANWLSHLEYDWDSPVWRHWLSGLAKDHTLIRYDERGCGLSDWDVAELSVDAFVRDLETVVDTLGLERFPLLGISQGGPVAITYAVRHPEKVSHLILYGTYARGRLNRGYSQAEIDLGNTLLSMIKLGWGTDNPAFRQVFTSLFMPEATSEQRDWFNELQRKTTSPENALRLESAFFNINVSHLVPWVSVPTLVLHAPQDGIVPYSEGQWLAEHIPNARLVNLDSRNHILLETEPAHHHFLEEVHGFIAQEWPVTVRMASPGVLAETETREIIIEPNGKKPTGSVLDGIEVFQPSSAHNQALLEDESMPGSHPPVPAYELPHPGMPFLGRGVELVEVQYMLIKEPDCRLVTIIGPGGIGKTSLAIQVASTLGDHFPDGVVFVPLQPITSADYIAPAIADALRFNPSGGGEGFLQLLDFMHEKHILLVMDNFEHLLGGSHLLERILRHCPGVKFLVTTRQALNLQEEWLYSLQGLPYPREADPADAAAYTSVQLFTERARRVRRDFSLDVEWQGVVRICQLVEGIPLAIELAASWTRTLGAQQIAQEIQRNIDFLATRMRDIPERHRSMQAVFDQSWSLLNREEQSVFKRLSVFRGGFQLDAARYVSAGSLAVLSVLVDKSLLRIDAEERYEVHELLRQYAQEQLANSREELERIRDLHCSYYIEYLHARLPGLLGGEQLDCLADVKAEMDNIRFAWQWAVETGKIDEMHRSLQGLDAYYQYQSRYLEGLREFEKAAHKIRELADSTHGEYLLAQTLVCMGWLYVRLGQLDEANRSFEESQEIYTRISAELFPPPGIATDPLVGLSLLSNMRGEYDCAVSIAEHGREQNEARQDKHNLAFVYYVLTSAYMAQGDYTRALHAAEQAYQLVNELQNSWFMAYVLNEWGNVARAMGRYAEARQRYLDSYDIRESFNDPEGMAVALSHLGRIAILERDFLAGKSFYQQSFSIYQNINDRGGLSTSLAGLGSAAAGLGELEKSGDYLRQALQTAWDIHHLPLTLATLIEIAELYLRSGLVERAIELLLFVREDPASDYETRHRASAIVEQNTSQLAGFQFAAAQKRVEAIQIDHLVEALLLELNVSEKEM